MSKINLILIKFFELLTKEISEISLYLEKLLIEIKKTYEIIGLLSWCNFLGIVYLIN